MREFRIKRLAGTLSQLVSGPKVVQDLDYPDSFNSLLRDICVLSKIGLIEVKLGRSNTGRLDTLELKGPIVGNFEEAIESFLEKPKPVLAT